MMNQQVSLFLAFIAGLASFISPCILPLIPAYISFITGTSIKELAESNQNQKTLPKVFLNTSVFILGFSVIFILLGASATLLGGFILQKQKLLQVIGGIVVIVLGLHIAGVFKLRYLEHEKRISLKAHPVNIIGSFVTGVVFALAWIPCIGPILASILIYAGTQETVSKGIVLLSAYSLGLAIPFLITSLAINAFLNFSKKIKKYFKVISLISGIILIIIGILIITGNFNFIL